MTYSIDRMNELSNLGPGRLSPLAGGKVGMHATRWPIDPMDGWVDGCGWTKWQTRYGGGEYPLKSTLIKPERRGGGVI